MNLTRSALRYPAGVAVIIAVVMLFGGYSLTRLPVQLFPDIENPQISIQTGWRGASPREIESEIVEPIEDVLRGRYPLHRLKLLSTRLPEKSGNPFSRLWLPEPHGQKSDHSLSLSVEAGFARCFYLEATEYTNSSLFHIEHDRRVVLMTGQWAVC